MTPSILLINKLDKLQTIIVKINDFSHVFNLILSTNISCYNQ